jgi:phenylacetate-coenzyme A ligase PaaK-like adenylate-forming protein
MGTLTGTFFLKKVRCPFHASNGTTGHPGVAILQYLIAEHVSFI